MESGGGGSEVTRTRARRRAIWREAVSKVVRYGLGRRVVVVRGLGGDAGER